MSETNYWNVTFVPPYNAYCCTVTTWFWDVEDKPHCKVCKMEFEYIHQTVVFDPAAHAGIKYNGKGLSVGASIRRTAPMRAVRHGDKKSTILFPAVFSHDNESRGSTSP